MVIFHFILIAFVIAAVKYSSGATIAFFFFFFFWRGGGGGGGWRRTFYFFPMSPVQSQGLHLCKTALNCLHIVIPHEALVLEHQVASEGQGLDH